MSGVEHNHHLIEFISHITADVWYHVHRKSSINVWDHPHRSIDPHSWLIR